MITKDYNTPLKYYPHLPLTNLEKRFLKTISLDPRFKLFCDFDISTLEQIEPLYTKNHIYYFDKFNDSDPYEDEKYIMNFKIILKALHENRLLKISYMGNKGILQKGIFTPRKLEYSQKNDKFRLICLGKYHLTIFNLARIKNVKLMGSFEENEVKPFKRTSRTITITISNYRNALERSLIHFSHFEKETRKIDEIHYEMKLTYYIDDETEVLIRVLSFGPMIKVTSPDSFISLIKERLENQKML